MKTADELRGELDALYKGGDRAQLECFFTQEALEHAPSCCSVSDEYIFLMNEAGSYYRSISEFSKSISLFSSLARTMERFDLSGSIGYATVLNNLAGSYRMAGNYESARSFFAQSIALYEALDAQDSFGYASALNNLSICCHAAGEHRQALEYQRKALQLAQTPEAQAASYTNLAAIYDALGQPEDATAAIAQAISILKTQGQTDSTTYFGALHTQACLHLRSAQAERAAEEFCAVMDAIEATLGQNADYAAAARGAAIAFHRQGKLSEALRYARQAAGLTEAIFGPEHPRTAAAQKLAAQYETETGRHGE